MNHLQSIPAEQSLLGALMLDKVAWELASDVGVTRNDFVDENHRAIYTAIAELAESGADVDVVTVAETLEDRGISDYVMALVDICPAYEHAKTYAQQVVNASHKRQLSNLGFGIEEMIREGSDTDDVQDHIASELMRINSGAKKSDAVIAGTAVKRFIQKLDRINNGETIPYTTGIKELDRFWRPEGGRLYVIAARPKMGKSTLSQIMIEANCMPVHNGQGGVPIYHANMEMPAEEFMGRHLASLGRVDRNFFKTLDAHPNAAEEWPKLSAGATRAKEMNQMIDFCPGATVQDIVNRSRAWFRGQDTYREKKLGMLVVDHLHLIKLKGDSDVKELGIVTKTLKRLAGEMDIPVVLLCQLNRSLEQRPNKRPMASDLRGSGSIEEDADVILGVYRDEVYNEDSPDKGIVELITIAARDGETGTARAVSNLKNSRFEDMVRPYEEY